ncbi:hypothetical protein [Saccharopolyspora griseoalba]|uniref:DUF8129 domain-containing protein n=1 Tax=Saccharopolyspora griseoalba TaxID=1431848 RepID=A0ABW2LM44_9PSEU
MSLPLPDYDNLPVGSLQHRIRSLTTDEVQQLLDYEQEHNDRPQVVTILSQRLEELHNGAVPSQGRQLDDPVETEGTSHGSPVDPSGSPQPMHPPRHGTGELPGKPKADRPRKQ